MVHAEMQRVLEGASFRSSPRCRQFLKFVVTCALEGRQELLKERSIGIELFGRDPAYPTEGDSIVRVRATEVRRRLLQHYAADSAEHPCRIEMPSGSYVPQFRMASSRIEPVAEKLPAPPLSADKEFVPAPNIRNRHGWAVWAVTMAGLLAISIILFIKPSWPLALRHVSVVEDPNEQQLEKFWRPAIRDAKPVLLCIGTPTTYTFTGKYHHYLDQAASKSTQDPSASAGKAISMPDATIPADALMPVHTEFVGAGDANLAVLLSAFFSRYGKATQFELSEGTSYSQISDAPTVLIGAFSNQWTLASLSKLPFSFVERNHVRMVEENEGKRRVWTSPHLRVDGRTDEDFAVVTRLSNSETGKFLVTAAGISGFGSRAAGYFLTRPDLLARALDSAPKNWPQKNIQFVLMTRIVDNAPTAPTVVAQRVW